ncbi:PREDICTED: talin-2-like [Priapulus caudatus]|uniref:Talin-2-like n=1 Tax=Priapulus caudatus TaxID=37621 RepID=A0ABM1EPB7_PRICU|nr:PREDICTED: talin-2-like [Priapulus caudatus]
MVVLSLKISVVERNVSKTIQFDPSTIVYDACRIIREKVAEANIGQPADYNLFLADEDVKKGVWLEPSRSLEYYMLRNADLLEYKKKIRTLRVRMLDGSVKTLLVDDSKNVGDLMVTICTRIGITNYDEYSLVRELPEEKKEQYATLRKEKEKTLPRGERKMEELRRKLHTDEEINWVDHGKTLREQGVDENETLLLRRKYFFSDQNIDSRDPVQLNLLYVQCRDAIVDGTHPVSQSQATQFAGIQCHIQFGDHVETKHKHGFLDLKEFLPKEYCKAKGIEKKIFVEHKKCLGLNELEAKVKYTQQCRSLKTYGVTFFLVKEKLKGKNRLVPRLLGITKQSVMRVDEKTKEIIKEWPLTHVRRWAASPNSFTLDFGDYSDAYYSVQTPDGEPISQLIAGYIDIILKKKKAKDHFGIEGDDESTLLEDTVSPYKATIIEHQTQQVHHPEQGSVALPGVMRSGDEEKQYRSGAIDEQQQQTIIKAQLNSAHVPPLGGQAHTQKLESQAQRALITNIHEGTETMQRAQVDLKSRAELPQLGDDASSLQWKENTMDVKRQAVVSELSAINTGTAQVINLTGSEPDDTDYTSVGSAVTTITSNFDEMSKNVRVLAALMEAEEDGENLLESSRRLAQALIDLMQATEPETQEPRQTLLNAASKVGDASGDVMKRIGEQEVDRAYQVSRGRRRKPLPTRPRLRTVLNCEERSRLGCDDSSDQTLIARRRIDTILTTTDKLFLSMGNASEMVKQARILAQATSQLVNAIKGEAEDSQDSDLQKRLLAAAKLLADATARMVEAAKGCATSPHDPEQQQKLRKAAEDLRSATNAAAQNALKKKLMIRLELAAKQAAAAATQDIAGAQKAGASNKNMTSQQELVNECRVTADHIPRLVQGIKRSMHEPENSQAQLALISASQQFLQPAGQLVVSSKTAVPTVGDQAAAMQLSTAAKNLQVALAELRSAAGKAQEACGSLELDSAIDTIYQLDKELESIRMTAVEGRLRPLPEETAEGSALRLSATSKQVGSSMAQLLSAAAQGDESYTGIAARETANSLAILKEAVRGVAATTDDKEVQERIIEAARDVMNKSARLLEESKKAVNNPNNPENQQRLGLVAKAVSHSLNNCISCLPGQRDVDSAIKVIGHKSQELSSGRFPDTHKTFAEIQLELNDAAAQLNEAAGEVVSASQGPPAGLADASEKYGDAFCDFMDSGMTIAGLTREGQLQGHMVTSMKNISMVSSRFLLSAKSVSADPNAPNAKNQLAAAARAVTKSINQLLNLCSTSAPGQKECDSALRRIRAMRPMLDDPSEPVNDTTYYECLDVVMDNSKHLGNAMTGIANTAKKGELESFGRSVKEVADAVCALIEAASQSAYLVGIADPSSEAGRPGLVDQAQFARASQAIQVACQNLTNPASSQQQVLQSATIIAKHTSSLCNSCRIASSKTTNPVAKRQFVQSAKDVANATANLVKAIKVLDSDYSDANRAQCAQATRPLIDAVENLTIFASSPEFASIPAKISQEARQSQEPITSAGKTMIDGSCCMITAAKSLSVNPKDPPTWQLLAAHSKNVSDSIKKLVTSIRDKAPGQKECDEAIYKINVVIKGLDHASLAAVSQNLAPRTHNSLQGFQEQMVSTTNEITETVEDVRVSGRSESERLGHYVTKLTRLPRTTGRFSIGCASKTMNTRRQMALLEQTKTVAECSLQLVHSVKEGGETSLRENILKTAKALVEDTKTLVAGAASSQEQLAAAAQSAVRTITRLADVVKFGAASLGTDQSEAQVLLINAVKDVALALGDLISATKNASGKSVHDPAMANLKGSAKVMVTNVTSLLKTVKTVEDEAARGTRAVESAISAIDSEMKSFDSAEPPRRKATIEDLLQSTRPITSATARTVAAGNSGQQHDAIVAANMGRKAVIDLLVNCKAIAYNTESEEARQKVMEACRESAAHYGHLLSILLEIVRDPSTPMKSELIIVSRRIASSITELVQYAEYLKDEENYHSELTIQTRPRSSRFGEHEIVVSKAHGTHAPEVYEWENETGVKHRLVTRREYNVATSAGILRKDGDWPEGNYHMVAERELLDAAASIEAASRKLAMMRPTNVRQKENGQDMNFEEQILEAAKSLTSAIAALIKSATTAQRELVMMGHISGGSHYAADDSQWSHGLISAAQMVAAATQSLCEAANAVVQGMAGEEKLISSAKQVASSTAQLLVACKVKMHSDSPTMIRLQTAGNAVKKASDLLVQAAQETQEWETDRYILINKRLVGGIAQEISAQEEILRKERELEEARYRLLAIRKAKYKEGEGPSDSEGATGGGRYTDGESDF